MNAKWIWKKNENNKNTWMNFIKHITLSSVPESVTAKIAVDSKYWLYINGELAVFEGGVKRGEDTKSTYYDEIEIAPYLKKGENTIAVRVWYFGDNGFSHLSSGNGGLLFEADADGEWIVSDSSWKALKDPAYTESDSMDAESNFRLAESNIYFDAVSDIGTWYSAEYDTSSWDNADEICDAGKGAYGRLVKRIIPQLKYSDLQNYENSAAYEGLTVNEDTVLKMKLPYNAQVTPYLKVSSPKGLRISIKADTYDDGLYDTKSVIAVYYTRDGVQEYESLGWINGEYMYYTVPAGVTILSLKYRESGYDTDFTGEFECDDEFLNRLWKMSQRTLYITMRDNFMDCPDRERAQWWGDVNVEMQMMMYGLDTRALLLYKKGVDTMAGWARDLGYILTVVPTGKDRFELPFQNLAGIWGFMYYYDYTGDIDVIKHAYPMSREYILNYPMSENGLAAHKQGSWDWQDWGEYPDIMPMENAWYYMAVSGTERMARLLGHDDDARELSVRRDRIKAEYDRAYFKGESYYNKTENGRPDDRANALAVISGLASADKYEGIARVLCSTENSSPYMEKYVLDALCEMGYYREAVERMKRRYKEMVEYDYSTLWEYWNQDGTLNHAWSGGPLVTMSKYIAGIKPVETAYKRFSVKPNMCGLKHIRCVVPTVKGDIVVEADEIASENRYKMTVNVPMGTVADVYLPTQNGYKHYECGEGMNIIE